MNTPTELLKDFFSLQHPLGLTHAKKKITEENRDIFRKFFHKSNKPFQDLQSNPTMIVGRRGSGKTEALLTHEFMPTERVKNSKVIYFDDIDSGQLFQNILFLISNQIRLDMPKPFVETVSSLWDYVFWVLIFRDLAKTENCNSAELNQIKKFVDCFDFPLNSDNPYHIAHLTLQKLIDLYHPQAPEKKVMGFFAGVKALPIAGESFDTVKDSALNYLTARNINYLILLDSFEELDITGEDNRLALSGLLKCVGSFKSNHKQVDIRCCIPAEIYLYVTHISSNILKDFAQQTILHWSAGELLQLSAKRYAAYLELWHRDIFDKVVKEDSFANGKEEAQDFWRNFLPDQVPNMHPDIKEETIPYILRHTQLLPRHVLLLLNKCIIEHREDGKSITEKIDPYLIQRCVRQLEGQIAGQILTAYRHLWPDADSQLERILPQLGHNVVSLSHIHRIFNKSGIAGTGNVYSFPDFVRLLTELGIIGRMIKRTERYIVATYEYTEPFRLIFNDSDKLCIHPCFSQKYRVLTGESLPDDYLPIYPLGSELADPDRREQQETHKQ